MTKTTKKQGAPGGNGAPPADTTPESLDKVRDILFGGQMRAVETRLQGLEARLLRGQESLRTDFTRQLGALAAELKEALRGLEKRHVKLEETSGMADADLREGLMRLSNELTRSAQELKAEKLGITALAGMFGDMASRLAAEAKGTGKNASRG